MYLLARPRTELSEKTGKFAARAPVDPATGDVTLNFLAPVNGLTDYASDLSVTRKLERQIRQLWDRVDRLTGEVLIMEEQFGNQRWQPTDARYQETLEYIRKRRYHKALAKLQRLVIQRLFELHKMNLSQTGGFSRSPTSRKTC